MKTKEFTNTKTRRIVYLRVIKDEGYIVAGSLRPVVWADQFDKHEDDENVYETLITTVPVKLAKRLETMGEDVQHFSDGYEAFKKTEKYLKNAEVI